MICVLLGPPCSGKTTLGEGLAEEIGLPHVVASAELRGFDGCSAAVENADVMQVEMIMARLRRPDCKHGCILDNFPRNTTQAEALEEALQKHFNRGVSHVLDLEVPMRILESRASKRLVHRDTGLPAHIGASFQDAPDNDEYTDLTDHNITLSIPPQVQEDIAAHEVALMRREDDAPERVQRRLQRYAENIASLRGFYGTKSCTSLDGAQSKHEVLSHARRGIEMAESFSRRIQFQELSPSLSPLPGEPPSKMLSVVRQLLEQVENRLQVALKLLQPFLKDVQCRWCSDTATQPCGCRTMTNTYVGKDPPDLTTCGASASEMGQLLKECNNALWTVRESYMQRQFGDVSPWFSWLLILCCTTSVEIEGLQARYYALYRKAADIRNTLTTETAKTAKQTTSSYCSQHLPTVIAPGSP